MWYNQAMRIQKRGFTLIELLVVIAIIGIISAIALVSFNNSRQKSRDSRRMADVRQIDNAIQLYISQNGHAPYLNNVCDPNMVSANCVAKSDNSTAWTTLFTDLTPFIKTLPNDPCLGKCGTNYYYVYETPGYAAYLCNQIDCSAQFNNLMIMYNIYANSQEMLPGTRWELNNIFLNN